MLDPSPMPSEDRRRAIFAALVEGAGPDPIVPCGQARGARHVWGHLGHRRADRTGGN